jgi:integrase
MAWTGEWPGGRVWTDAKGRKSYVIRKSINGRRFEVSTKCSSLRPAMKALEEFEKDPLAFLPGKVTKDVLKLDDALIEQFCSWSRSDKKNTAEWVEKQRAVLTWWKERLGPKDLRRLTLTDDIDPHLVSPTGRAKRIAVLKALFGWLRKNLHRLTNAQDPTLDLTVPQSKPAQWTRSKVITREQEQKIVASLPEAHADVARLLSATGIHVSEARRFAAEGDIEVRGTRFVLCLPHTKSGGAHKIDVDGDTAEVARRVRDRGEFSESSFYKSVQKAAKALGLKVGPGQWRHTFATREVENGADPAAIAAYLHHASPATTRRFYAVHGVVPRPTVPAFIPPPPPSPSKEEQPPPAPAWRYGH